MISPKPLPYGARDYADVLDDALQYIEDRRQGRIKSFKTPWSSFNRAGINGIEWGSMVTIGARPGAGKTMIVSQILREAKRLNPDQEFNVLEFQFEMGDKQYGARQFAAEVALDYNKILSADVKLDDFVVNMIKSYITDCKALRAAGVHRKLIKDPLTHLDIEKAVHHYFNAMGGKPMIVTIDHSWLIKKDSTEREKLQTLYNAAETMVRLKNNLPVIIVMLTQLNRTIEEATRRNPGTLGNYPTSGDIFGGDALMQSSDMVVALSRPSKLDINIYGNKSYEVNKSSVFMHLIKIRNGNDDDNIIFMEMIGSKQKMIEVPEPIAHNQSGNTNFQRRSQRNRIPLNVSADIGDELQDS